MSLAPGRSRYNRMLLDMHIPDWDADFLSQYDPAQVVAAQAAAGAGSVMVYCQSHLGLCYWPVKHGRAHPAMGDRDWLAESLAALKQAGCEAYGYYSVIFNNQAFLEHPDWRIEPRPALPGWAFHGDRYGQVCPNHPDYRRFVEAQLTDLLSRYRFDAFFFDMTFWRSVCTCPSCRARFRSESHADIPARIDWADKVWCEFQTARERWLIEFTGFLNAIARRHGITRVYHNFAVALFNWKFGMSTELGQHNDILGGDFYGDMDEQFLISRYMLNLSASRSIEFMTSRCVHLTDHVSTKPEAQLQMQGFAALASSAAFRLIDAIDPLGSVCEPVYALLGRVFGRLAPYHPWLGGEPVEDVAVYLSDASKMNLAENGRAHDEPAALSMPVPHVAAVRGVVTALREQHIPVGVITARQIGRLSDYRVVVLADAVRLSEDEAAAFASYVEGGGHLYVSGKTASHSLTGRAAVNPLASCLGVTLRGTLPGNTFYLNPADDEWRRLCAPQPAVCVHEAIEDIAACAPGVEVLGSVGLPYGYPHPGSLDDHHWASIHSAPPAAMEEHPRPAVTRHRHGQGRAIYAAAVLEREKHHVARRTLQWLLAGLLEGGPGFHVDAPAHVWFTVFHQPDQKRYVLHLLNYPADLPPAPLRDLKISVRKRAGISFTRLLPVPFGVELPLAHDATHVRARLPALADYAMLLLEYGLA